MKSCPFCGSVPDLNDLDTLYPNGIYWRFEASLGIKIYIEHKDRKEGDKPCYEIHCSCGAVMHGDGWKETSEQWNRRA